MGGCVDFCVLMSLYDGERPSNLAECFESLKNQTLQGFSVILVIDGPIRSELEHVISSFEEDIDFRVLRLQENVGLAGALNEGLSLCDRIYIFRMDTDDIALPKRFEAQASFLSTHPEVDVLGALIEEFDPVNGAISVRKVPETHAQIQDFALFRNPISHPVVCFKKDSIIAVGGYPLVYPEDHLLWLMLLEEGYRFHNMQEILLRMRVGNEFIKRRGLRFLRGEIFLLKWLYKRSKINFFQFVCFSLKRFFVRASPGFLKVWVYRNLRS